MAESEEEFIKFWKVYQKYNKERIDGQTNILGKILAEKNACDTIKSMLSIGHGEGEMDLVLIKKYLKNLEHYYGEEPRKQAIQVLENGLKALSNRKSPIEPHMSDATFEEYDGPGVKVDFIFINHVMYHVTGDHTEMIGKAVKWLAPGGYMLLNHADPEKNAFILNGEKILCEDLLWRDLLIQRKRYKQHLKEIGWTVEAYPYQWQYDFGAPDEDLRRLCQLYFIGSVMTDDRLQQIKDLIRTEAKEGTKGCIETDHMATLVYKA